MIDIVIVIKGGVCQDVFSTDEENTRITLIDIDNLEQEEKPEVTRGNYPLTKTDCEFIDIAKDVLDNYEIKAKAYEPIMQCCTCESCFEVITESRICPECGSGNWVFGYIDEEGNYGNSNII